MCLLCLRPCTITSSYLTQQLHSPLTLPSLISVNCCRYIEFRIAAFKMGASYSRYVPAAVHSEAIVSDLGVIYNRDAIPSGDKGWGGAVGHEKFPSKMQAELTTAVTAAWWWWSALATVASRPTKKTSNPSEVTNGTRPGALSVPLTSPLTSLIDMCTPKWPQCQAT